MNSSRILSVLLLSLAGLTPLPASAISQLYVFIVTGDDDLRTGSSLKPTGRQTNTIAPQ